MRNIKLNWLVAALVALVLSACASMPAVDTLNKRAAVFEIGYQEVLSTAILYDTEKRLTVTDKAKLNAVFDRVDAARSVFRTALIVGDKARFDSGIATALTALEAARAILTEKERK